MALRPRALDRYPDMSRLLILIPLLVIVLAAGGWELQRVMGDRTRAAEVAAERSVAVLPPGTRDAWIGYERQRVALLVRLEGPDLLVGQPPQRLPATTKAVSRCDPAAGAGAIVFDPDGQAIVAPVFGLDVGGGQPPPLGVRRDSVAALRLADELCKDMLDQVNAIRRRAAAAHRAGR